MISKEDYLKKLLMENFSSQLTIENIVLFIIKSQFEKYDLELTDTQEQEIINQISSDDTELIKFELTEIQEEVLKQKNVNTEIFLDIRKYFDEFEKELPNIIGESQQEIIELVSSQLVDSWVKQIDTELQEIKKANRDFERDISNYWGKPLSLLEALIDISREIGSDFNITYREEAKKITISYLKL